MTAPLRRRTRAREIAMQTLFQLDLRSGTKDGLHGDSTSGAGTPGTGTSGSSSTPGSSTPGSSNPGSGTSIADICRESIYLEDDEDSDAPPRVRENASDGSGDQDARAPMTASEREIVSFAERLVTGALEHRDAIDAKLQSVTRNWDLRRMAIVDRNVLRMAVFELMFCADVPPKVAINEAIEVGKKFSTANSGGFVNGILDRIRIDLEQANRTGDNQETSSDKASETNVSEAEAGES